MSDKQDPNIKTRAELDMLIADRRNDPPTPALDHPKPSWMLDSDHEERVHVRMRERRIRYLTRRLDKATMEMENEFDRNS